MKMEKLLLITSGKGPAECERAAYKIMALIRKEALRLQMDVNVLSVTEGTAAQLVRSALISIKGESAEQFARAWTGSVQWTATSPFRPHHKRRNWFVGIAEFTLPELIDWNERDVKYESLRSSGPGGQHVNKTESAVRATHVPTGVSVVASDERSQSMNKQKATERLRIRLAHINHERQADQSQQQWQDHAALERGNAKRVITLPLD
jgi:peptide chain release factor